MSTIKLIKCEGTSKEDAFKNLPYDPNCGAVMGTNITHAWKKEGSPMIGSKKFMKFIAYQLGKKTKNTPGLGVYITLTSGVANSKSRPYKVINYKPKTKRKWLTKYVIRDDELVVGTVPNYIEDVDGTMIEDGMTIDAHIVSQGKIIQMFNYKKEAVKAMKKLITKNQRNYSIAVIKIPDIADISAYGIYSPSSKTNKGVWLTAGIPYEDDDKIKIEEM